MGVVQRVSDPTEAHSVSVMAPPPDGGTQRGLPLETIVAEYPDAIIQLDLEGRIQLWNRGAELTFGYSADEVLGQGITILLPEKKKYAKELELIRRELEGGDYVRARETVRRAKDGSEVPVLLTETVLRDGEGQPYGSFVILKDITERKRLERRLIQSERLSVIGKMASHLAHEIKNPLSSILLNAELLGDEIDDLTKSQGEGGPDGAEARTLLSVILREVRQLRKVAELYLDFARPPRNVTRRVSINGLLRQIIRFLKNDCAERTIRITKNLSRDLPWSTVDPIQLKQALLNIVRNAIDAIKSDGELTIASRLAGEQIEITVADDGCGMTADSLEQLYTPFFTTKATGTGLGVAYAQQVILDHNGEIRCTSAPREGATFTITLPVTDRQ